MRYIENLLTALIGRNPYQQELDAVRKDLNECLTKVERLSAKSEELGKSLSQADDMVASYTKLVEVLRERIKEKDAELELYRKELAALNNLSNQADNERQ